MDGRFLVHKLRFKVSSTLGALIYSSAAYQVENFGAKSLEGGVTSLVAPSELLNKLHTPLQSLRRGLPDLH